ncbi:DMT family transporter [Falsiroseomonas selenitidurans]|uniref:DMT family transporter n=1 Tax=Falsiroseomonas selenitidurans TaxID=2716335 RepID=A0ABX1E431_9PROT|nr:DMT family transporter [Falsiroseomonas selenitidurans]NKC31841.1 DMT family transporter [Falsiroseomonas selenitidurans]
MPSPLRILAALLTIGLAWGMTPTLGKLALAQGMRPLGIAAIAASISTMVLFLVAAWRRDLPRMTPAHLRHYLLGGLVGMGLANFFAFTGLQRAPAGLFALLVPLAALFSVVFFAMAGLERATPRRLLATLLGLAGVALAMAPGAALPDPALLPWAAIMLLTPVCYAASNLIAVKLAVPGSSALSQAAGTVMGAAVTSLLLALAIGQFGLPGTPQAAAVLLAHGLVNALGYLVYFRLLVGAGGVVTSQTSMTITLCGLFYGWLVFAETPGWLTVPAVGLIFGGLALASFSPAGPSAPLPRRTASAPRH